jgi:dihydroxy-acid dehydratase
VPAGRLELLVSAGEMARRRSAFVRPKPHYDRGYGKMFLEHVTQSNEGCDFDFLKK